MVIHLIFYLYAIVAIVSALGVIVARNPVNSVLSLVVTFFATAGIWMLLHAEFLAIILVLVYVGAVMTLFLFVVMMLNIDTEKRHAGFVRYSPFGIALLLLIVIFTCAVLGPHYFGMATLPPPALLPADYSNTQGLGDVLYTQYAYPFEIAGVILLTAMIAAISLAHHTPRRKRQDPRKQIAVRAKDRVRLVDLRVSMNQSANKEEEHA